MKGCFDKKEIREWVVYKITNPIGQIYVGCTFRFKLRMSKYRNNKCPHQARLHQSITNYGFDAHTVETIDTFSGDKGYANGKEIFWIKTNMCNFAQYPEMGGLNQSIGGVFAPHLQTKENRKKAMDVIMNNPEIRLRRNRNIALAKMGKKHTIERVQKNKETAIRLKGHPIVLCTLEGVVLREYEAINEAVDELNIPRSTVHHHLKDTKNPKTPYTFKYKGAVTFKKFVFQRRVFQPQDIKEKIA